MHTYRTHQDAPGRTRTHQDAPGRTRRPRGRPPATNHTFCTFCNFRAKVGRRAVARCN